MTRPSYIPRELLVAVVLLAANGCGSATTRVASPAPGAGGTPAAAPESAPGHRATEPTGGAGDALFMQNMIAHHAQALTMTALVPSRSATDGVRVLAERMTIAQRDEIEAMERWLRRQPVHTAPHGGTHGQHSGDALMPGMLSVEELAQLAAANGHAFDRLFLLLMIRHHEGALTMVERLFATPGAAQDTTVYFLASDIDADQRAEIARMRMMLERLPPGP